MKENVQNKFENNLKVLWQWCTNRYTSNDVKFYGDIKNLKLDERESIFIDVNEQWTRI